MNKPAARHLDPVVMMVMAIVLAIVLTWLIPAGQYLRGTDGNAVPGSFRLVSAHPAGPFSLFTALQAGMLKASGLIFMLLFLAGMFGVLRATRAMEAVMARAVVWSGGRAWLVAPVVMVAVSAGSTTLGLTAEYLIILPVVLTLAAGLNRTKLFGLAMVAVAYKIGYLASVTNPLILVVAQPLAGVPIFSGLVVRLALWVLCLSLGIIAVLREGRRDGPPGKLPDVPSVTFQQGFIVFLLAASVAVVIVFSTTQHWRENQFAAVYAAGAMLIGLCGRMRPGEIAHAFVDGMKDLLLGAFLVGMASAVEIVLVDAKILDSIVHGLASLTTGLPKILVGEALMLAEMVLTLLIPSTSAKAALSMPIIVPIAGMSGISGQTTVLIYILANGLVNLISPTSGVLLAYLATAQVPYLVWLRFVFPLFFVLALVSFSAVALAVILGY